MALLRRIYNEAPDIFELVLSKCSIVERHCPKSCTLIIGKGGLNNLRLVNRRFKQVVETCATRISSRWYDEWYNYFSLKREVVSLPVIVLKRHKRIEHITVPYNTKYVIKSLEGCPAGLKTLFVNAEMLSNLGALAACKQLEIVFLFFPSSISDLSPLAALSNLKEIYLIDLDPKASLLPLASCSGLELLDIKGGSHLEEFKSRRPDVKIQQIRV